MDTPLDRTFQSRNDASRRRLEALLDRLTPADLEHDIDGWSVGVSLAHLAFWDRFVLARWLEAAGSARDVPLGFGPPLFDLVNEALVPEWARLDLDAVRDLVLDAASRLDAHTAALPDDRVAAVVAADMTRMIDRATHRTSHLAPIEALLANR